MAISNFNNGDSLSSVRIKLNSTIDEVNDLLIIKETISTNTTIAAETNLVIITQSGITATLPDISTATKKITIKNTTLGIATITGLGSDTIENESDGIISGGDSWDLYPNTTTWILI